MLFWLYPLQISLLYASNWLMNLVVNAQQAFSPAALPLAVRGPYLNSWQSTGGTLANPLLDWTRFWTLEHVTAWAGFVKVDDNVYNFLGGWPGLDPTILESTKITPTRTLFTARAGPVRLNITFFSPVEPEDLVKQSFPFSYMSVDIESTDGQAHAIALYTDVTGEWASHESSTLLEWKTLNTDSGVYHQFYAQKAQLLTENNDLSKGSTFYYAMSKQSGMNRQTGADAVVRGQFIKTGTLVGTEDNRFRVIGDSKPVFAFSANLGTINRTLAPIVWAIGQDQNPVIKYNSFDRVDEQWAVFWRSKYADISDAINAFLLDFPTARDRAVLLDARIMEAAGNISANYTDLVSLATRQVFGSIIITSVQDNMYQPYYPGQRAFMRETGNGRRTNPVEKIFAALPLLSYVYPSLVGFLLEPLLQSQTSFDYPNPYAAPDLGTKFPDATGNPQAHNERLEKSANMLIIAYAHARYSTDGSLLTKYHHLFRGWAEYLVNNTLCPNAETADNINQSNNTNLAIKGIIAIKVMSEISNVTGSRDDATYFSNQASNLVETWHSLATASDHLSPFYDDPQSDGLPYNLYIDKMLQLNLIPDEVYDMQASYYAKQEFPRFGPLFNSGDPNVNSPWIMFTAAALRNNPVSKKLLDIVHLRAGSNSIPGVFPMTYKPDTGETVDGQASPAMGAMFSFLALDLQAGPITVGEPPGPTTVSTSESSPNPGVIAGAVVGSVSLLILAGVLIWRKKRASNNIKPDPRLTTITQFLTMSSVETPAATTPDTSLKPNSTKPSKASAPPPIPIHQQSSAPTMPTTTPPATTQPITPPITPTQYGLESNSTAEPWRNEIMNLRREINEIREQRLDDPPPQYPTSNA